MGIIYYIQKGRVFMKKIVLVFLILMLSLNLYSCKKVDTSKQVTKDINNNTSIDKESRKEKVTTKAKEATSKTINDSSQEATTKSEVNTSATIITSIEATESATMAPIEKEVEIYTEAQTQPYIESTQPYIEPTQPQIQVVTEEPTTQVVVIVQPEPEPEPQTEAQTQAAELTWALSYEERLQAFIDGVNHVRQLSGLSTFTMADLNPDAMNYAQSWAEQMAAMGKHTHGTGDQSFESRSTVFCRTYGYPGIAEGVDSDVIDHILGKSTSEYEELFGEGRLLCEHIGGDTNARWTYLGIGMAEGYKISPISGTPYKAIFYCFVAI